MTRVLYLCLGVSIVAMACADDEKSSVGISPTGTYAEPIDDWGDEGYLILDEVCEGTDSERYMERFATPMFRDVAVIGDVAFVVDGSLLWAVSIADPNQPERISLTRLPGNPVAVDVTSDGFLLVANGTDGILIIDVANPESPMIRATLSGMPGMSLDVSVEGDRAYVAAGNGGIYSLDISDTSEAKLVKHISVYGFANRLVVKDSYIYVAACSFLVIVAAFEPDRLIIREEIVIPEGHARDVAVDGDRVLVAAGKALFSVSIETYSSIHLEGYYDDKYAEGFYVNGVVARDGIAYIAAGDESFRAVNVHQMTPIQYYLSDKLSQPDETAQLDPPGTLATVIGDPINVGLFGNHLFVLGNFRWVGERLLRIMDVSSPGLMRDKGRYAQPDDLVGIDLVDNQLVAHFQEGMNKRYNLDGTEKDAFKTPKTVIRMERQNNVDYILTDDNNVYRSDSFGTYSQLSSGVYDLAVSEKVAAVTTPWNNGLELLDTPEFAEYYSRDVVAVDDAFLGFSRLIAKDAYLYAYDWAMGTIHTALAGIDGTLYYFGESYVGQCEAYDMADFYSGKKEDKAKFIKTDTGLALLCPSDDLNLSSVQFIGLSNPPHPEVVDSWALPDERYMDFRIVDNVIYTIGFDNNLYQSTLQRFEPPTRYYSATFDGHANGLTVIGDDVIVADGDFGLRRFRLIGDAFEEVSLTVVAEETDVSDQEGGAK